MRMEQLAALFNALFLVSCSNNIFCKAVDRLIHPQKINVEEYNTEMIVVSIGGLLVNISGLFILGEDEEAHNDNLKSVFLHVLADTLGSLGVLVSCWLIKMYNWHVADPICALVVSVMIFVSVLPLLLQNCYSLFGTVPK